MIEYVQKVADRGPSGEEIPFDPNFRFCVKPSEGHLMDGLVDIVECSTGILRQRLTQEQFDAKYEALPDNGNSEPSLITIPVQSADGTQFILTVQSDGSVTAAPVSGN